MFIYKLQLVHMGDIFFLVLPIFHICTVIGCYFLLKSVARILTTKKSVLPVLMCIIIVYSLMFIFE